MRLRELNPCSDIIESVMFRIMAVNLHVEIMNCFYGTFPDILRIRDVRFP